MDRTFSKIAFSVTTFYKFVEIPEEILPDLERHIFARLRELKIHGLLLLGTEGVNATVAGRPEEIEVVKAWIQSLPEIDELEFKDSSAASMPFRRLKVEIRPEIVALGDRDIKAAAEGHLSPTDWEDMLEDPDVVLLDVRNDYETEVGIFKDAIDPKLKTFGEFKKYVEKSEIPKNKKILMYCTGGIRCEKAAPQMRDLGYPEVYQLSGGILKYLEEFPNSKFDGECFVFDHRVAVDQDLKASKRFGLCPHCGDPGDRKVTCSNCNGDAIVCASCIADPVKSTCSKNCRYHYSRKVAVA